MNIEERIWGNDVSVDAYVQTIGSFWGSMIGAVLSAVVALLVVGLQRRIEQNKLRKIELENFLKSYRKIHMYTNESVKDMKYIIPILKDFKKQYDPGKLNSEDFELIERKFKLKLERYRRNLNGLININDDYIPADELFEYLMGIRENMEHCYDLCMRIEFKETFNDTNSYDDIISTIEDGNRFIEETLEKFKNLSSSLETELILNKKR